MQNIVTRYLADYINKNQVSLPQIQDKLNIPMEKLFPGTKESLTGDELLRLCQYLRIRPENIPLD